jgi:hypothetical protein
MKPHRNTGKLMNSIGIDPTVADFKRLEKVNAALNDSISSLAAELLLAKNKHRNADCHARRLKAVLTGLIKKQILTGNALIAARGFLAEVGIEL